LSAGIRSYFSPPWADLEKGCAKVLQISSDVSEEFLACGVGIILQSWWFA